MLALLTLTDLGARFRIAFIRPIANTGLTDLVGSLQVELQEPTDPAQESAIIACGLLASLMRDTRVAEDISLFVLPVSEEEAPGYSKVIEEPMDITRIFTKALSGDLKDAHSVLMMVKLMVRNAMTYNDCKNVVHVAARRLMTAYMKKFKLNRKRFDRASTRPASASSMKVVTRALQRIDAFGKAQRAHVLVMKRRNERTADDARCMICLDLLKRTVACRKCDAKYAHIDLMPRDHFVAHVHLLCSQ